MPLEYSIGDFPFVAIRGEPTPLRTMIEMDQRNGVDGSEFTLTGFKGEPFQLLTQVDAPSYTAALAEADAYTGLVDEEPVDLILAGVLFGPQVKVLAVRPVRIQAIRRAVGGINPPSLAWIEAVWDLVAIETPPT